jgi:hypothetical protein
MEEAKKDLPAHHYPARRSSQGKRQAPREATEKAADGQGLPAATASASAAPETPREATEKAADGQGLPAATASASAAPEKPATEPPKLLSRVAQGLLLPPTR